jgi:hypothetical protein
MMQYLVMRTTVTLDDEVYELASVYASARGITLGSAIGELVRKTHTSPSNSLEGRIRIGANGIPVVISRGGMLTSEMVKATEEDEVG